MDTESDTATYIPNYAYGWKYLALAGVGVFGTLVWLGAPSDMASFAGIFASTDLAAATFSWRMHIQPRDQWTRMG